MTAFIHAPDGVRRAGIGLHALLFDEAGIAPDPGLNAGERAYLQGLGYTFADGGVTEQAPAPEVEPEPEPEPEAEPTPAPKRRSRARKAPAGD